MRRIFLCLGPVSSIRRTSDTAYIAVVFEHPTREAPDKFTMQLHAEVANGALADAGLDKNDVDAVFSAGVPEYGKSLEPLVMADYLGLDVSYFDSTDIGGHPQYFTKLPEYRTSWQSSDVRLTECYGKMATGLRYAPSNRGQRDPRRPAS